MENTENIASPQVSYVRAYRYVWVELFVTNNLYLYTVNYVLISELLYFRQCEVITPVISTIKGKVNWNNGCHRIILENSKKRVNNLQIKH